MAGAEAQIGILAGRVCATGAHRDPVVAEPPALHGDAARLYRRDGYAWAKQRAAALRRRDYDRIDWKNVIEEIESIGRSERKPRVSNCALALVHVLAIEHCKTATPANPEDWET